MRWTSKLMKQKMNQLFCKVLVFLLQKKIILYSCPKLNLSLIFFFFLVMPDGTMYAAEHEISLQMEGLDKPRRKRGRPPKSGEDKSFSKDESQETRSQDEDSKQEDDSEEIDGDGRRRRKRKTPKRFDFFLQYCCEMYH